MKEYERIGGNGRTKRGHKIWEQKKARDIEKNNSRKETGWKKEYNIKSGWAKIMDTEADEMDLWSGIIT